MDNGGSNHPDHKLKQPAASRLKISWILDSFRQFTFDSIGSLSSKPIKGRVHLHKAVHEELMHKAALTPCNDKSSEEEMQTKIEKMQQEMNFVKHKNGASSEMMEPLSSNKSSPEELKQKLFLMPDRKRIMIRSRL